MPCPGGSSTCADKIPPSLRQVLISKMGQEEMMLTPEAHLYFAPTSKVPSLIPKNNNHKVRGISSTKGIWPIGILHRMNGTNFVQNN